MRMMRKVMPLLSVLALVLALSTAAAATLTVEVSYDGGASYTETYDSLDAAVAAVNAGNTSGLVYIRTGGSEAETYVVNPRTGALLTEKQNLVVEMGFAFFEKASYTQYQQSRLSGGSTESTAFDKLNRQRREPYLTPGELSEQREGYLDCSSFVWAVYNNVFGDFEERFYPQTGTIMNMAKAATIGPNSEFVYLRELTAADRNTTTYAEIAAEMKEILQPGDIIDFRRTSSSGHALLYVGNGYTIESTGSDYDYVNATEKAEAAALLYTHVDNRVLKVSTTQSGSMFRGNTLESVTIMRPLNGANLVATDAAKAYAANSGISVTKTAKMRGQSVEPGERITYTIKLDNTPAGGGAYAQELTVSDPIGTNVTFIRADNGGKLVDGKVVFSDVAVAANASVTLTYTVAVKPDAVGVVAGTTGNANGIEFKCADLSIGTGMGAAQNTALLAELSKGKSSGTALSWLNSVYSTVLGKNFGVSTDSELFSAVFTSLGKTGKHGDTGKVYALYKVNVNTSVGGVADALTGSITGGYGVFSQSQSEHKARIRYLDEAMLKVGDVLATVDVDSNYAYYVYRGSDMLKVTDSGTSSAVTTNVLQSVLADSRFMLLRPSMIEVASGEYVAAVNGTLYHSLADAFAATASATSATVIEFFGEETFTGTATLTLNQYTQLSVSGSAALRGDVTIDGAGLAHSVNPIEVDEGAALTLADGVTLTGLVNGGAGSAGGFGALRVRGNLFLDGVTVSNCSGSRGALYSPARGYAQITGSTFEENKAVVIGSTAQQGGGAMFAYGAATVYVVEDTEFAGNSSESEGGAVKLISNATITLTNCSFTENTSATTGGAINVTKGAIIIDGVTMSGNTANNAANDIYVPTDGICTLSGTVAIEKIALAANKTIALGDTLALKSGAAPIVIDGTIGAVVLTGNTVGTHYTLFTGASEDIGVTSEGKLNRINYTAKFGQTKYATFAEAMKAAQSAGSGTVTLLGDAEASGIMLKNGMTLDLNGKTLACSYLIGFNGCDIVDGSTEKTGLLKCARNALSLGGAITQIPIWNGTDGYFFEPFALINKMGSAADGTYTFIFRPEFATAAREAIVGANGGDGSGIEIRVRLFWNAEEGKNNEKYLVYKDEFVKQVCSSNKALAFRAYITGYESYIAQDLKIQVVVVSDFGTTIASEAVTVQ